MDALEPGLKLHAKADDGFLYPAEVVQVSEAKKRAKAPVKVHFVGYGAEEDLWLPLSSLKSKKLIGEMKKPVQRKVRLPKEGIKIYYWPATGKAAPLRLMLAEAGVSWEDICFEKSEQIGVYSSSTSMKTFASSDNYKDFCARCREKGQNLTSNTPMLELGGKFYTQSTAEYRFLARKAGFYPRGIEDAYVVDNVMAHVEDAKMPCYNALRGGVTSEEFMSDIIPKHLGNLERILGDGDFFVQGMLTVADFQVFDVLHNMYVAMIPEALKDYPKLAGFYERIASREKIKEYLASDKCKAIDKFIPLSELK